MDSTLNKNSFKLCLNIQSFENLMAAVYLFSGQMNKSSHDKTLFIIKGAHGPTPKKLRLLIM